MSGSEFKNLHNDQTLQGKQRDMLMTKAMRENAELKSKRSYNYCLVRIRFPNSTYLEVLYGEYESSSIKILIDYLNFYILTLKDSSEQNVSIISVFMAADIFINLHVFSRRAL